MSPEIRDLLKRWRSIHWPQCVCGACEDTDAILAVPALAQPPERGEEVAGLRAEIARLRALVARDADRHFRTGPSTDLRLDAKEKP